MKTKIAVSLLCIFLVFSTVSSWVLLSRERKKSSRLESNIRSGYESGFKIVDYYKAKNGQLVARNKVLEFSSQELRSGIASDVLEQLKNLGIKPKYVTNYSETVVKHEKQFITFLKDSIVFDTIKAKCFNYSDSFYTVNGCSFDSIQSISITSVDSLIQVVYKGPRYNSKGKKMPGAFFWIPRRLYQVISSNNPDSKITYSKTISITK